MTGLSLFWVIPCSQNIKIPLASLVMYALEKQEWTSCRCDRVCRVQHAADAIGGQTPAQTAKQVHRLPHVTPRYLDFWPIYYHRPSTSQNHSTVTDGNRNADILNFVSSCRAPIDKFMSRFILYRNRRTRC